MRPRLPIFAPGILRVVLALALGASATACAGQSQATRKHLADLEETVVRLQNGQDRLEDRLGALEMRARQESQKPAVAVRAPSKASDHPALEVIKLAPGEPQAGAVTRDPLASPDVPPADPPPELDAVPRPVLRATGHHEGHIDERPATEAGSKQSLQAVRQYKAAISLVRGKQYGPAIQSLAAFVKRYPDHPYADNALYWCGECYYAEGKYEAAAKQFRELTRRYPTGNKVPDALLKLGMAEVELGRKREARASFALLSRNYPGASAARRVPEGYREP